MVKVALCSTYGIAFHLKNTFCFLDQNSVIAKESWRSGFVSKALNYIWDDHWWCAKRTRMSKSSGGRAATQSFVLESPVTSNFFYLLYYFLKWCRNENGVDIPLCWFYRLLAFPFSNKNVSQKFNLRHSVHQSVKTSNRPSKWNIIGVLWNKKTTYPKNAAILLMG